MEQLNKIELRGIVGSSRLQTYQGRKVVNFTLATSYVYKNKTGDPVIETTWHNVNAWEGKNMPDLQQIDKGVRLYVLGRVKNQRYVDSEGVERTSCEVSASQISIIDQTGAMQYEMM